MNQELYKSPDSLPRLRIEVIIKATNWANAVIDESAKSVPSTFNSYSPAEDLNHANKQSEQSLAHFKKITDTTLNDTPNIIKPVNDNVFDINNLRNSVDQAYANYNTPSTAQVVKENPSFTNTPNFENLQSETNSARQFPIPSEGAE